MANYAFLDMNNIVTEVVAGRDEGDTNTNWELEYQYFKKQICKRTSYNTMLELVIPMTIQEMLLFLQKFMIAGF